MRMHVRGCRMRGVLGSSPGSASKGQQQRTSQGNAAQWEAGTRPAILRAPSSCGPGLKGSSGSPWPFTEARAAAQHELKHGKRHTGRNDDESLTTVIAPGARRRRPWETQSPWTCTLGMTRDLLIWSAGRVAPRPRFCFPSLVKCGNGWVRRRRRSLGRRGPKPGEALQRGSAADPGRS